MDKINEHETLGPSCTWLEYSRYSSTISDTCNGCIHYIKASLFLHNLSVTAAKLHCWLQPHKCGFFGFLFSEKPVWQLLFCKGRKKTRLQRLLHGSRIHECDGYCCMSLSFNKVRRPSQQSCGCRKKSKLPDYQRTFHRSNLFYEKEGNDLI